jgi:DNA-binding NarL/FixJ family response regulator
MRVLLVTGDARTQLALQFLLRQQPEVSLVVTAEHDGPLAAQVERARPDIVLLDWDWPGPTAQCPARVERLAALRAARHRSCIIVVSSHWEAEAAAVGAGADAFVSKGDPPDRLLAALHSVRA